MNTLAKYTIVALLISIPILLAISRRYGTIKVTAKQVGFISATFATLLIGSANLFSGHPTSLRGWVIAITILLLCWVYVYFLSSWMHKQLHQK
jgi:hypothetical protein